MRKLFPFFILVVVVFTQNKNGSLPVHFSGLELFLGNTYKGLFINSTKKSPMIDVMSFEKILNGNAIKIIHSVNKGEFNGETVIMMNPDTKKLQSWYFTSAGTITIKDVYINENNLISIEDVTKNQNGITKVKTIIELIDKNQLQKRTKYLMNNLWKDGSEIIYKLVHGVKPKLN